MKTLTILLTALLVLGAIGLWLFSMDEDPLSFDRTDPRGDEVAGPELRVAPGADAPRRSGPAGAKEATTPRADTDAGPGEAADAGGVSILVEVVDEMGVACAGIPVEIRKQHSGYERRRSLALGMTDADGKATIRLAELPFGLDSGAVVGIVGIFGEAVEVAIDLESPPEETLRLTNPPSGYLEVVAAPEAPTAGASFHLARKHSSFSLAEDIAGDRTRFGPIGLGQTLRLSYLPAPDSSDAPQEIEVEGPQVVGETRRVTFDRYAVPMRSVVVAELVDPEGRTIGPAKVNFLTLRRGGDLPGRLLQVGKVDAGGHLRRALHPDATKELSSEGVRLTIEADTGWNYMAEVAPISLVEGENPLGQIVVEPLPILLAGRVVDELGRGLPGVEMMVFPAADGALDAMTDRPSPMNLRSGAEGRFEFRSCTSAEEFQIRINREGWSAAGVFCHRGADDVVIRVTRRARVELRCRNLAEGRMPALTLEWTNLDRADAFEDLLVRPDGRAQSWISPGRYDFLLRPGRGDLVSPSEVIRAWRDVVVEPGSVVDLGQVDIEAQDRDVEVILDLGPGQDATYWTFEVREADGGGTITQGKFEGDGPPTAKFHTPQLGVEMTVRAPDQPTFIKVITKSKDRIYFGPINSLQVELASLPDLPVGSWLSVRFENALGYGGNSMFVAGGESRAMVGLAGPGRYEISVGMNGRNLMTLDAEGQPLVSPAHYDLRERELGRHVQIKLAPELLARLKEAGKRRR